MTPISVQCVFFCFLFWVFFLVQMFKFRGTTIGQTISQPWNLESEIAVS